MTAAAQTLTAESGTTITETWVGGMVTGIANQNPILTLGVQTLGDSGDDSDRYPDGGRGQDHRQQLCRRYLLGGRPVAGPILNVQMRRRRRCSRQGERGAVVYPRL